MLNSDDKINALAALVTAFSGIQNIDHETTRVRRYVAAVIESISEELATDDALNEINRDDSFSRIQRTST